MNEPTWILDQAILIAHEISIANFGGSDGVRDLSLLETAQARPRSLFASLHQLAAAYTCGIVKNHPFVDGNRRTGFLAGATFLEINGLRLTASEFDATRIIVGVAAGEIGEDELAAWFVTNTTA